MLDAATSSITSATIEDGNAACSHWPNGCRTRPPGIAHQTEIRVILKARVCHLRSLRRPAWLRLGL